MNSQTRAHHEWVLRGLRWHHKRRDIAALVAPTPCSARSQLRSVGWRWDKGSWEVRRSRLNTSQATRISQSSTLCQENNSANSLTAHSTLFSSECLPNIARAMNVGVRNVNDQSSLTCRGFVWGAPSVFDLVRCFCVCEARKKQVNWYSETLEECGVKMRSLKVVSTSQIECWALVWGLQSFDMWQGICWGRLSRRRHHRAPVWGFRRDGRACPIEWPSPPADSTAWSYFCRSRWRPANNNTIDDGHLHDWNCLRVFWWHQFCMNLESWNFYCLSLAC